MRKLSPAEYVIYIFGGVRATARAVGRTPPVVSKWAKEKGKGRVPVQVQPEILRVARERNLDITAEDLILGRVVEETADKTA